MKSLKRLIICIGSIVFLSTHIYANTSTEAAVVDCITEVVEDTSTKSAEDESDLDKALLFVEEMPEFPGGQDELSRFISRNVRYPIEAQENGIQGRVFVSFVIDRDGTVIDIKIIKSADKYLDAEAIRVVGLMPKWTPGKQKGKLVKVQYTLPIYFKL